MPGSHGISRSASQPLDTPRQLQQQQQHPAGEPSPADSYTDEEMGSYRSGAEDDGTTSRDAGPWQAEGLPGQARSSGSSEHGPQEPAGLHLHAGETKRVCLICLVSGMCCLGVGGLGWLHGGMLRRNWHSCVRCGRGIPAGL